LVEGKSEKFSSGWRTGSNFLLSAFLAARVTEDICGSAWLCSTFKDSNLPDIISDFDDIGFYFPFYGVSGITGIP
jgi:hypothetical protein